MPEPIKPNKIDGEEFLAIIKDLGEGKRISQQELADAIVYADALPELKNLTKALVSGWNISMNRIAFNNQQIARLDRKLRAIRKRTEKAVEA